MIRGFGERFLLAMRVFSFDHIRRVAALYLSLLPVVAILIAIGVFRIHGEPEAQVLEPIYIFNMTHWIKAVSQLGALDPLRIPASMNGLLAIYGEPDPERKGEALGNLVPYERVQTKTWQRWSGLSPRTIWYHLGVDDSLKVRLGGNGTSAMRTNTEKTLGLQLLITEDCLDQAEKQSLKMGPPLRMNPLKAVREIASSLGEDRVAQLGVELVSATRVYSIVSISNKSSEAMEGLRILINDVLNTGMLEVVGWSAVSQNTELKANGPNIRVQVERLAAGQSIEILLRGNKLVRPDEIQVSMSPLSGIEKNRVLLLMLALGILVLLLHLVDLKLSQITTTRASTYY